MKNLNLKSVLLAILLGVGFGTILHAQQELNTKEPTKKIIIIKKSVDEDGNQIIEKIVKEGDDIESIDIEGVEGESDVSIQIIGEGDGENTFHFFSDEKVIELNELEDIQIDIEEDLDLDIDIDEDNDFKHYKFRVQKDGEEPEIIEWRGSGEMPAEIKEKMEKMKFKLAETDGLSQEQRDFMYGYSRGHRGNGAFLGVVLNDRIEVENGVEVEGESRPQGAYISDVRSESAAEKAGLQAGDIITDIDGEPVASFSDLTSIISKHQPEDKVSIAYLRDGKVQTTDAVLGTRERKAAKMGVWHDDKDYFVTREFPCLLIGIYTETVKSVEGSRGVKVTSIIEDTPAEVIDMQAGDVILALDGVEIHDHEQLTTERDKHSPGDKVSIVYLRDGQEVADEITFRQCDQDKKEYVVRRGPNSKRDVKKNKRIIIIKKKKKDKDAKTDESSGAGIEEAPVAEPRLAPKESKELSLNAFRAFPNPTNGMINVRFEGEAVPTILKVTDVAGRELYREDLEGFPGWYSNRVDLNDAVPGTLLLTVQQGDAVFTEKIVLTDANRP